MVLPARSDGDALTIGARGARHFHNHIDDETRDIRDALEARAVEVVNELLGQKPSRPDRRNPRWGSKGSFSLALTGPKRGLWHDHETGDGGDLFALILRERGGDFPAAKAWARRWLGWAEDYQPDPTAAAKRRREHEAKRAREAAKEAADEACRIAEARAIWTGARAIEGTPGDIYLRSTRAIGARAWPHHAVRWSDRERAVVVAVTNDEGEVVAVQCIRVTSEGLKDETRGPAKLSHGPVRLGAVRLPGPAAGPLLVVEGPETGLTVWAATGYETFILLGGMKRAPDFAPEGQRIVLCRDDDKQGSQGVKAGNAAKDAIARMGGDVRDAWPWSIRLHDKSDFNDLAKVEGLDAVRERIDRAALDEPELGEFLLSLVEAERRIGQRVGEFFDLAARWQEGEAPPVHALGVSVGTGKTEAALRHALRTLRTLRERGDERAVVVAVPEHRLSAEVVSRFRAMAGAEAGAEGLDLLADVWRGREARRPGGVNDERMCGELETMREAQRLHADIDGEVCGECPLRDGCAYLAQRGNDADLWVVAHQALFREPPKPIGRRGIAAVVVDESPWQAGLVGVDGRGIEVPLDWFDPDALPTFPGLEGERLVDIRAGFGAAMREGLDGPVKRETLAALGFTESTGDQARAMEWRRKAKGGPWRERKDNETLGPMTALWRSVEALMAPSGPERSGWLRVDHNAERVRVVKVTGRREIAEAWRVPTMLVDAVLEVELARHYWPNVETRGTFKVRAPHQTVRQLAARSYAKGNLAADNASGERARRKVKAQILRRVRELGAEGRTLVISNKSVIDGLNFPAGVVETAHFNAVAGRDRWRTARLVVVIGRAMPRPSDVERMASALTGAAVETIPAFYDRGETFRLKRTGAAVERIPAQRETHPDPTADRILRRIVEGELTQAIGRGRGVRRGPDSPVEVLVFGDVILAEPVDEFLTDGDMAVTPADLQLAAGGVAFDEPLAAAAAYRDIWRTPGAAKKALQRESWGTKPYERFLYGNVPQLSRVAFHREGVGQKRQLATVDPRRVPNPRALVERLVGPLAHFEIVDALVGETLPTLKVVEPPAVERVVAEIAVEAVEPAPAPAPAPAPEPVVERLDELEVVAAPAEPAVEPEALVDEPLVVPALETVELPEGVAIDWGFYRDRAKDCGVLLGDVARAAGVSPSHFRNMQTGFRKATLELAAELERVFATMPVQQGRFDL